MLTRRLLPLAAVLVLLVGAPALAVAAPPGGACPPGQDNCWVWDKDKGKGGDNGGGDNGGDNGGGDRKCTWGDKVVPCYDPVFGWFNQTDGCYYKETEPQRPPPPNAPTEGKWYTPTCQRGPGMWVTGEPDWFAEAPGGGPDPLDLALEALAGITLRGPDIQIRPDANGAGLVGLPVWLWVDKSEETWGPLDNFAVDGGLRVDIEANVTKLTFDLGDGTTIDCSGGGTPYETGETGPSPDCGHVYTKSSRKQPGGKYTITATTTWTVTWWTSSSGDRETLGPQTRTSEGSVRINELQVVTE